MAEARGYYSLIQFCPDLSRLEAANLGVALYCPEGPEGRFLDARVTAGNDRARRFSSGRALDPGRLNAAKDALRSRLLIEGGRFSSAEDFRRFTASCANDLQMTDPRPLRTGDPARDLDLLFDELVERRRKRWREPRSDKGGAVSK